jgi:hypothetical protein
MGHHGLLQGKLYLYLLDRVCRSHRLLRSVIVFSYNTEIKIQSFTILCFVYCARICLHVFELFNGILTYVFD